jgi:hypothetical protein
MPSFAMTPVCRLWGVTDIPMRVSQRPETHQGGLKTPEESAAPALCGGWIPPVVVAVAGVVGLSVVTRFVFVSLNSGRQSSCG